MGPTKVIARLPGAKMHFAGLALYLNTLSKAEWFVGVSPALSIWNPYPEGHFATIPL